MAFRENRDDRREPSRTSADLRPAAARGQNSAHQGVAPARAFIEYLLRGYCFITFWNHPIVGAALGAALFVYNFWAGLAALLGNSIATAAAVYLLKVDRGLMRYGLFGANGMFITLSWVIFLPQGLNGLGLPLALAGLSAPVTRALLLLLTFQLHLPVLAVPFVVMGWLLFVLSPHLPVPYVWSPLVLSPWWIAVEDGLRAWVPDPLGFFRNVSQLLWGDSTFLGLGIFGIWLARVPLAALTSVTGFFVSWWWLGVFDRPWLAPELKAWAGVNGALTGLCLGGTFIRPTLAAAGYGIMGAIGAAWLTAFSVPIFLGFHLPVFVAPSFFVTLLMLSLLGFHPVGLGAARLGLLRIPLTEVGRPEDRSRRAAKTAIRMD